MSKHGLTQEDLQRGVDGELRRIGDMQKRDELPESEQVELRQERLRLEELGYIRVLRGHRRAELEVVAVLRALECETLVDISNTTPEAWAKPNDVRAAQTMLAIIGRVEVRDAHCVSCGGALLKDRSTCPHCAWVNYSVKFPRSAPAIGEEEECCDSVWRRIMSRKEET